LVGHLYKEGKTGYQEMNRVVHHFWSVPISKSC